MHLKKSPFDPHIRWVNRIEEMKMMWDFGVLEPLGMTLEKKKMKALTPHVGEQALKEYKTSLK